MLIVIFTYRNYRFTMLNLHAFQSTLDLNLYKYMHFITPFVMDSHVRHDDDFMISTYLPSAPICIILFDRYTPKLHFLFVYHHCTYLHVPKILDSIVFGVCQDSSFFPRNFQIVAHNSLQRTE